MISELTQKSASLSLLLFFLVLRSNFQLYGKRLYLDNPLVPKGLLSTNLLCFLYQ